MDLETAKKEILYDAAQNKNRIYLMGLTDSACVKGYYAPVEWRQIYVAALNALQLEGSVEPIFKNKEMQLFAVTAMAPAVETLNSAKEKILQEIQTNGFIYKIHSRNGEFVQCADENFADFEGTRMLYNRALGELLRRGVVDVVEETREMCTYAMPKVWHEQPAAVQFESFEPEPAETETLDPPTLELVA